MTKREQVKDFLVANFSGGRVRIRTARIMLRRAGYGHISDSTIRRALNDLGASKSQNLKGKSTYWTLGDTSPGEDG